MKRFSVLAWCLSIGVAVFCGPATALAAPNPVVVILGGCATLEDDCKTLDKTMVPDSAKASVNKAGVWTSTCTGTTTVKPAKATKCDGETLNGGTGESSPQFACAMELLGEGTNNAVFTDDWSETITPSGHVTMKCKFDAKEKGN